MKTSLAVACLLGLVAGKADDWDYTNNGENWVTKFGACKNEGGSPIDLNKDLS